MGYVLLLMILAPLIGSLAVAQVGARQPSAARSLALVTTLATLMLAVFMVAGFKPRTAESADTKRPIEPQMLLHWTWLTLAPAGLSSEPVRFEMSLGVDGISLWMVALTALLMVSSVLISWESITEGPVAFYSLLLFLESGMIGVFCALDVVLFYIFFEFTLLPLFFLIGIWGGPKKRYAALKFFIYTLAGSVIGLVGVAALTVMIPGRINQPMTFDIPRLAEIVAGGNGLTLELQQWIFLALFAGFAIKVPLAPFHTWLPLAHVEAPTAGSVLLAGVLLKLGTYGFYRLCLTLLPGACATIGVPLVATLATIGVIYGSLCALAQNDIKRLVAYSSVAHLGFCMLGLFALNAEGITGGVMTMINHGLSTGALFLLVGMLYERYHTRQLSDLGGLAHRMPILACFMVFIVLSSVGLPGLNGFVGEVLVLIGMFKAHKAYAIVAAVGIVLGAWYLFNMLQRGFFGPLREPVGAHNVADIKPRELAALVPICAACLWIGVYPKTILDTLREDVNAIVGLYEPPKGRTLIVDSKLDDAGLTNIALRSGE